MTRLLVNARELRCPLPLLKLKQALVKIQVGDFVEIESTDAGSWRDIPAFIAMTEHELVEQDQADGIYCYLIKKGE